MGLNNKTQRVRLHQYHDVEFFMRASFMTTSLETMSLVTFMGANSILGIEFQHTRRKTSYMSRALSIQATHIALSLKFMLVGSHIKPFISNSTNSFPCQSIKTMNAHQDKNDYPLGHMARVCTKPHSISQAFICCGDNAT